MTIFHTLKKLKERTSILSREMEDTKKYLN